MATTRIIPMHINKGKTIAQCMKARIDYVKDPDKTEDGEFISSYACAPESADQEFVLARNQYLMNAGNGKKNEVIAYQLRQSFKPGEVSAEEANKIGYELAERLLHGEHAFIVATHTDRKHIYFEKGSSTTLKMSILRRLFALYDLDPMDLVFYLRDAESDKAADEGRYELRKRYWTYALPIIQQAHSHRGSFSNVTPGTSNWCSGYFGVGGFSIC